MPGPEARYALALFSAVRNAGGESAGEVREALDGLSRLMETDKGCREFFCSPLVSDSRRKQAVGKLFPEEKDLLLRNFLMLLAEKKRFVLLPLISARYNELYNQSRNHIVVRIFSARELPAQTAEQLTESYRRLRGADSAEYDLSVQPELLGGVCVRIGDMRYDDTLRTRLKRLETALTVK